MDDCYHVFGRVVPWIIGTMHLPCTILTYASSICLFFQEFKEKKKKAWKFLSYTYTVWLSGYTYMYTGPVKLNANGDPLSSTTAAVSRCVGEFSHLAGCPLTPTLWQGPPPADVCCNVSLHILVCLIRCMRRTITKYMLPICTTSGTKLIVCGTNCPWGQSAIILEAYLGLIAVLFGRCLAAWQLTLVCNHSLESLAGIPATFAKNSNSNWKPGKVLKCGIPMYYQNWQN